MAYYVSPELYAKYKEAVMELGLSTQEYVKMTFQRGKRGLTDKEIAQKLGLEEVDVAEIRAIAEIDLLPANSWWEADQFKAKRAKDFFAREKKGSNPGP